MPSTIRKVSYAYDPKNPAPTIGGPNLGQNNGPQDQRKLSGRTDVLRFVTEPLPSSPSTRTASSFADGATPAIPRPLLVAAPAMPATWVPCGSPTRCPGGPLCQSPLPHPLPPLMAAGATAARTRGCVPRSTNRSATATRTQATTSRRFSTTRTARASAFQPERPESATKANCEFLVCSCRAACETCW